MSMCDVVHAVLHLLISPLTELYARVSFPLFLTGNAYKSGVVGRLLTEGTLRGVLGQPASTQHQIAMSKPH